MDASLADKCFRRIPAFFIPPGWPEPGSAILTRTNRLNRGSQGAQIVFDGRLSKDGEVSCASCRNLSVPFATYDHDLSHGVSNSLSTRNAPVLVNLAWMKAFHWDGGVNHLEVQPLHPDRAHRNGRKTGFCAGRSGRIPPTSECSKRPLAIQRSTASAC